MFRCMPLHAYVATRCKTHQNCQQLRLGSKAVCYRKVHHALSVLLNGLLCLTIRVMQCLRWRPMQGKCISIVPTLAWGCFWGQPNVTLLCLWRLVNLQLLRLLHCPTRSVCLPTLHFAVHMRFALLASTASSIASKKNKRTITTTRVICSSFDLVISKTYKRLCELQSLRAKWANYLNVGNWVVSTAKKRISLALA